MTFNKGDLVYIKGNKEIIWTIIGLASETPQIEPSNPVIDNLYTIYNINLGHRQVMGDNLVLVKTFKE